MEMAGGRDGLRPQRCIWSPLALRVEPWRLLARTGGSSNRVKYTVYCIVNFNTFLQKRDPSRFRFLRLFDPRHRRFLCSVFLFPDSHVALAPGRAAGGGRAAARFLSFNVYSRTWPY